MKFSVIATIIATASAQITIVRPDKTTGVINSTPGCYGIFPDVSEVKGAENFKLEFYSDWSCKGSKVDESTGNKVFSKPVKALSIKVSPKTRARHVRASHDNRKSDKSNVVELLDNLSEEDAIEVISEFLPDDCNVYTGAVDGCEFYGLENDF
jgi:hypothetical protein